MSNLGPTAQALLRMRKARASRPTVDHNGHPTGDPATFTYDESGQLIGAQPGAQPEGES